MSVIRPLSLPGLNPVMASGTQVSTRAATLRTNPIPFCGFCVFCGSPDVLGLTTHAIVTIQSIN